MSEIKAMLAKKLTNSVDVNGWWMSEKLDGVRCIWDGTKLISRNGNVFHAPKWFTTGLPSDIILDGELFLERGKFQETLSIIKNSNKIEEWSKLSFQCFDIINCDPYEKRLSKLNKLSLPKTAGVLPQTICESKKHLEEYQAEILKLGGEGVMLRKPGSMYEGKRVSTLLKLKKFKDAEAVVLGYTNGKGRLDGKIGALKCEFDGKVFNIGSGLDDVDRENPPAIGSIVTFSYFEKTDAGVPRFPTFISVRDYE